MKLLIMILLLMVAMESSAQVNEVWRRYYNGAPNTSDVSRKIIRDNTGSIYITGSRGSNSVLSTDVLTLKYNAEGVLQWAKTYNGSGNSADAGVDITSDNSGNLYVGANVRDSINQNDAAIIKYSSSGTEEWVRIINGTGNFNDQLNAVYTDASGNIYATGYLRNTNLDLFIVKYNSAGTLQWLQSFNSNTSNEEGTSITTDAAGNVYVTGNTASTGSTYVDILTVKYNSSGLLQWSKTYAGIGSTVDMGTDIITGDSGNVYITGYSYQGSSNGADVTTIKYNSSGTQQWAALYNSAPLAFDRGFGITKDDSGNVFVGANTGDFTLIKYGPAGQVKWLSKYNGPQNYNDYASDMFKDSFGNIYMGGYSEDTAANDGSSYPHIATVKFSPLGEMVWSIRDTAYSYGYSIVSDNNGNIYTAGIGTNGGSDADILTLKYSSSVGIQQISNNIPVKFILSQNYPNPFNPSTKIKFEVPSMVNGKQSMVRLSVFDVTGRQVALLADESLQPGTYEYSFDGASLTSGVYFYKLSGPGFSEVKKMLLIK